MSLSFEIIDEKGRQSRLFYWLKNCVTGRNIEITSGFRCIDLSNDDWSHSIEHGVPKFSLVIRKLWNLSHEKASCHISSHSIDMINSACTFKYSFILSPSLLDLVLSQSEKKCSTTKVWSTLVFKGWSDQLFIVDDDLLNNVNYHVEFFFSLLLFTIIYHHTLNFEMNVQNCTHLYPLRMLRSVLFPAPNVIKMETIFTSESSKFVYLCNHLKVPW